MAKYTNSDNTGKLRSNITVSLKWEVIDLIYAEMENRGCSRSQAVNNLIERSVRLSTVNAKLQDEIRKAYK